MKEKTPTVHPDLPFLKQVKALLLDVDGVLTTGEIVYDQNGGEIKAFSVKDGLGIRMLENAGIPVCIVTGRASPALLHRLNNLQIQHVWDGVKDKVEVLPEIAEALGIKPSDMAFVGDDLPDLGIMGSVGVSLTVADAHAIIIDSVMAVTKNPGGRGAVREICDAILQARGLWDGIVEKFRP